MSVIDINTAPVQVVAVGQIEFFRYNFLYACRLIALDIHLIICRVGSGNFCVSIAVAEFYAKHLHGVFSGRDGAFGNKTYGEKQIERIALFIIFVEVGVHTRIAEDT